MNGARGDAVPGIVAAVEPSSSSRDPRISRRIALKLGLAGAAGLAVGVGSTALLTRLGRSLPPLYLFFRDDEAALLVEICDQIIPEDDAPGARQTGAIHYIDQQLIGPYQRHQAAYRRGLESFRRTCERAHGAPFASLTAATKIEILRAVETGNVPEDLWEDPSAPAFFNLVLAHTMQGFYGSPRHGGNRDYASYRMLGLDYPAVVGRNRPQQG